MKKILFPIILLALPLFLQAQSCSMRAMFRSYDPGKEVKRIHIPSCLTTVASWIVDDHDTRMLLKQIKSIDDSSKSSDDKASESESIIESLVDS